MKGIYIICFSTLFFLCCSLFLHLNVSSIPKYQDVDSKAYVHNALTFFIHDTSGQQEHVPYYALGYAFFIGVIYKLFGVNNAIVVWIQVLLALLTAFFLFRASRNLFSRGVGLITLVFFSCNLGFIVFSQFILTEILLAFLLVLFFERLTYFLKTRGFGYLFQAGFFLGTSIIVKPAAIYFIFPMIFLLLLFQQQMIMYRLKTVVLFVLAFYLPVCGYMTFNKICYGNFQVAPLGNENLYLYLYPKVLAQKNHTNYREEKNNVAALLVGSKLNPSSWLKIKQHFWQDLKQDPVIFIAIWMKNVFKTCVGLFSTNMKVLVEQKTKGGDISFFKTKGPFLKRLGDYISGGTDSLTIKIIAYFESLWTILRYFLIFLALLCLLRRKRFVILSLFIFYIFYFAMITGHDGCARFRMMFEPVLLILSAYGLWIIISRFLYKKSEAI